MAEILAGGSFARGKRQQRPGAGHGKRDRRVPRRECIGDEHPGKGKHILTAHPADIIMIIEEEKSRRAIAIKPTINIYLSGKWQG